jgi:hypothetical protein
MIGVYFPASDMTDEQYKALADKMHADGTPAGMKMHACFREGTKLAIFDVWESQEAFDAFGAKLMPAVQQAGLELSPPQVVEMVDFDVA